MRLSTVLGTSDHVSDSDSDSGPQSPHTTIATWVNITDVKDWTDETMFDDDYDNAMNSEPVQKLDQLRAKAVKKPMSSANDSLGTDDSIYM